MNDWRLVRLAKAVHVGGGLHFIVAAAQEERCRMAHGEAGVLPDERVAGLSRIDSFIKSTGAA